MQPIPTDDFEQIARWHFAVGGLDSTETIFELGPAVQLRRLKQFPTHEHLKLSLTSLPVAGAMAHYGESIIRHELVIDAELFPDHQDDISPTADAILAGLRIITQAEIICPAVCERSWADLPISPPNKCRAYHAERGQSHQFDATPKLIGEDDLDWVLRKIQTLLRLSKNERFQTAVDALCTYMLASSERMQVAQLWAGVEAVFDVQHELQFRISTLTARFLAGPGPKCREIYKQMKKLYGERSKIIHGKKMSEENVRDHITAVRGRLADILTKLIELDRVPSGDEFEEILFEQQE